MSQRIVVGIDDSKGARTALRWAIDEAGRRDATVEAVHGWSMAWSEGFDPQWAVDRADVEAQARSEVQGIVDEVVADLGADVVPKVVVVEGASPTAALVATAEGADLLVVGSRGRSALTALALGSVSAACVHRATGPVVVVPTPHR